LAHCFTQLESTVACEKRRDSNFMGSIPE
jgi:hypothetical protein